MSRFIQTLGGPMNFDCRLSRRAWLGRSTSLALGSMALGETGVWAKDSSTESSPRRSCIVLWMSGGQSQLDTFDLKSGHENGGPFREIQTAVPGIQISEHLPNMAQRARQFAIVRSMSTIEGDHGRASGHLHTGYQQDASVEYPSLGAVVAHHRSSVETALPSYVNVAPSNAIAAKSGFLGSQFAPLILQPIVTNTDPASTTGPQTELRVEYLQPPARIDRTQVDARTGLLQAINQEFAARQPDAVTRNHKVAYDRAIRLMEPSTTGAFDLAKEPTELRKAYGNTSFGQGCLLARRLVERGVGFVEVCLRNGGSDWDTHAMNFPRVQELSSELDRGWSQLIDDLQQRGLLESTLVVVMGEFGRTPKINSGSGRDHFPNAWSTMLAGGGIQGGQVIGRTSKDGMTVEDRPVSVPDFLATICLSLGIDRDKQNIANDGRPVHIIDKSAKPLHELLQAT